MTVSIDDAIRDLYQNLIDAWNKRDANGMAELFSEEGVQIGFDGSKAVGKEEVLSHIKPIFEHHSDSSLHNENQIHTTFRNGCGNFTRHCRDDTARKNRS